MKNLKKLLTSVLILILSTLMISCNFKAKEDEKIEEPQVIEQDTSSKEEINQVTGELKVHFIDVGQSDAVLIQHGEEYMLIDAGNNNINNPLDQYLINLEIDEFKYVIGTHPHKNHIGYLEEIVNSFIVQDVYLPRTTSTTNSFESLIQAVEDKDMKFIIPKAGETFYVGQALCTILAPNGAKYEDLNDYSIVIKVEFGNTSFMFTGDAEKISEDEMIEKKFNLKADVLKIGNHGSNSSTTQEFLNEVNPEYAVISVGSKNDYGYPNSETLERLNNKNIKTYRTDLNGTIIATSDGTNITFKTDR